LSSYRSVSVLVRDGGPGARRTPGSGRGGRGARQAKAGKGNWPSGTKPSFEQRVAAAAAAAAREAGRRPRGHISVGVSSYGLGYEITPGAWNSKNPRFFLPCPIEKRGKGERKRGR
jgi:hypothetical protein